MILLGEGNSFVRLSLCSWNSKVLEWQGCKGLSVYSNHYLGLPITKLLKLFNAQNTLLRISHGSHFSRVLVKGFLCFHLGPTQLYLRAIHLGSVF